MPKILTQEKEKPKGVKKHKTQLSATSKTNLVLTVLVAASLCFLTVGFAVYNQILDLSGVVSIAPPASDNIVVMDIKLTGSTNGASETYNCQHTDNSISAYATLPQLNSTATYSITVKNYSGDVYKLRSIVEDLFGNDNIQYSIDTAVGDKVNGSTVATFNVAISYKPTVTSLPTSQAASVHLQFDYSKLKVFSVTYGGFDATGFPATVVEDSSYSYTIGEHADLIVKMGGKTLVPTVDYTYSDGILSVPTVTGNLDIYLSGDILASHYVTGQSTVSGITITSYGGGIYKINGKSTGKAFARVSDYFITNSNNTYLMSGSAPNNTTIVPVNNSYDINYESISGTHNAATVSDSFKFVFRNVGKTSSSSAFGYDFVSGFYGNSTVTSNLGMATIYVRKGVTFDNFIFRVSVTSALSGVGTLTNTLTTADGNLTVKFYDSGVIDVNGTSANSTYIDLDSKKLVESDHTLIYSATAAANPRFHSGDNVKLTYNYISGAPTTASEISLALRDTTTDATSLDVPRIATTTGDAEGFAQSVQKTATIAKDASMLSLFIAPGISFTNFRFSASASLAN